MIWFIFIFYWSFMLLFQCRSSHKYDGYVDMKNYSFCSNLIYPFPKWLICFLFFNARLTELPLTIVIGQTLNYILFLVYLLKDKFIYYDIPILQVWVGIFTALFVVMCIDHEIYCLRYKNNKL